MKLHVGCGNKKLDGYVNIDIVHNENVDRVLDIRILDKYYSDVDEIYACHIFEHFKKNEFKNILKVFYNCLRKNGKLYICVPNFDEIVNYYTKEGDRKMDNILGLLNGGQKNKFDFHFVNFNFEFLDLNLEKAGFSNTKRYDWRNYLPYGYDDYSRSYLPHMDFDNGRLMSLNIVTEK
jgi:predicted SAM-dependent methyltransferase